MISHYLQKYFYRLSHDLTSAYFSNPISRNLQPPLPGSEHTNFTVKTHLQRPPLRKECPLSSLPIHPLDFGFKYSFSMQIYSDPIIQSNPFLLVYLAAPCYFSSITFTSNCIYIQSQIFFLFFLFYPISLIGS